MTERENFVMSSDLRKELIGIFLISFSVFLFLSLISYEPSDRSYATLSQSIKNLCGKAGSYVSDTMMQLFGYTSYILASYVFAYGLMLLFKKNPKSYFAFSSGLLLAFISFSAIFQALFGSVNVKEMKIPFSGFVGFVLQNSLFSAFGYAGSYVVLIFLLLSSVFLCTYSPLISVLRDKLGEKRREKRSVKVIENIPSIESQPKEKEKKPKQETFEFVKAIGPYRLPEPDLLDEVERREFRIDKEAIALNARRVESKLRDYGIEGEVKEVIPGPVVTLYEFEPSPGTKISRIVNLADDLAMALSAPSIRIVAPIPGKSVIGIEIPNVQRQTVYLREIIESDVFIRSQSYLTLALGKTIYGEPYVADLSRMPHLLVAGSTGSGKSVSLNSMILSILFKATPIHVRFLMIDLKMLELSFYEGIPHLLLPVVTNTKNAKQALKWLVDEMERRYTIMAEKGVRNIEKFNQKLSKEEKEPLPYIVVVIDELADLIMGSTREVEDYIARLAQMARASGIHLIVATQRPSVDVLTGIIKANFPARISFKVSSKVDSRTILDTSGAESLLGQGDMLFLSPGIGRLQRIHGPYVSEGEIKRVVDFVKEQGKPTYSFEIFEEESEEEQKDFFEDEKYEEAKKFVLERGEASISMIQRRFRIGYNRAARIIERMEEEGILGPSDGVKPRQVIRRK